MGDGATAGEVTVRGCHSGLKEPSFAVFCFVFFQRLLARQFSWQQRHTRAIITPPSNIIDVDNLSFFHSASQIFCNASEMGPDSVPCIKQQGRRKCCRTCRMCNRCKTQIAHKDSTQGMTHACSCVKQRGRRHTESARVHAREE